MIFDHSSLKKDVVSVLQGMAASDLMLNGSMSRMLERKCLSFSIMGKSTSVVNTVRFRIVISVTRHSGGGYQSSWGSANIALELLEGALVQGPVQSA